MTVQVRELHDRIIELGLRAKRLANSFEAGEVEGKAARAELDEIIVGMEIAKDDVVEWEASRV